MSQLQLIEVLLKVSGTFLIGLVLSRVYRKDPILRRWIWIVCFLSPIFLLIPLRNVAIPALTGNGSGQVWEARVYETEPAFASLKPVYLGDRPLSPLLMIFGALALVGVAVLSWRLLATLRLVRAAEQLVDEEVLAMLYELAHQQNLSDAPMIKRSDAIQSPCVWGVTQPVILIPAKLEPTPREWQLILKHELIHLRLKDPLWLVGYSLVRYVLWWNPLVWLGLREAQLAQEQIIDHAIGGMPEYQKMLLANLRVEPQSILSRLTGQGHLLTRIRAIEDEQKIKFSPSGLGSLVCMAALTPLLLPLKLVHPYHPDPSVVGTDEVLFQSDRSGEMRLWRMASDGRDPSPMADQFIGIGVPSISPDGKWLSYTKLISGKEDIFVARVDGTNERRIVGTPARDYLPRWSPDGSRLLFCTMATGNWELGLADLDSGQWKFLTKDGKRNLEPDWHPNGNRIIFSSHRTGSQKLWSMNLDGTDLVQLTYGEWEDTRGQYSANGRWLYYVSKRRTKYEATSLDLKSGLNQPLVALSELDTGEIELTDGDQALVMTSHDGSNSHIAKLDLEDSKLEVISGRGHGLWPVTRN